MEIRVNYCRQKGIRALNQSVMSPHTYAHHTPSRWWGAV